MRWGVILDPIGEDAISWLGDDWLVAIHVPFSLCERGADALITAAAAKNIAVLARRPLGGGSLAGTIGPGVRLTPGDDRNALDPVQLEAAAVLAAKLAACAKQVPPAARSCDAARAQFDRNVRPDHVECETVAELALRFVIDRGAIALPRLHRRPHVIEALLAGSAPPLAVDIARRLDT